jgi:hypothetical protein
MLLLQAETKEVEKMKNKNQKTVQYLIPHEFEKKYRHHVLPKMVHPEKSCGFFYYYYFFLFLFLFLFLFYFIFILFLFLFFFFC